MRSDDEGKALRLVLQGFAWHDIALRFESETFVEVFFFAQM